MKRVILNILKVAVFILIVGVVSLIALYISAGNPELNTEKIENYVANISVFDNDGNIVSASGMNEYAKYTDFPPELVYAFISVEDKRFFEHNGVDYYRLLGATWQNIKSFSFAEGASTITQQLIKNTHLSSEKTVTRKIQEMKLAIALEKQWDKEKIMESYLNIVYFGNNIYGVGQASRAFFSKKVSELSLEECATLAATVKSPAKYSPLSNIEKALSRRNLVLTEMKKDGKIGEETYNNAINSSLVVSKGAADVGSSFLNEVINEASSILNIPDDEIINSGLQIYTYLDADTQKTLSASFNSAEYAPLTVNGGTADALGIVTDNYNGGIIAYYNNTFYLSSALRRQPASTIKPFVSYMPALEKGLISPSTQIKDEAINLNGYSPNNYNENYYGWVNIRTAVAKSLNIPAVLATNYVGIDYALGYATAFGLTFDENDYSLATALGGMTYGLTSRELTNAYMALANEGNYIASAFISKICSADGTVLYERNVTSKKIAQDDTVYLMTDMLKTVADSGSGKLLSQINAEVACKTGTNAFGNTKNSNDMYNIAFTTVNTCFAWFGNIDNAESDAISSSYFAAKSPTGIVKTIFEYLYSGYSPANFKAPQGIVTLKVDGERLNRDHIVVIANEYSAEKLAVDGIFSTRNLPAEYAVQFEIVAENFEISLTGGLPKISFDTHENYEYKINRRDMFGNSVVLAEITDCKNESYSFVDQNVIDGNTYEYWVTPSFCSCKGNREGISTEIYDITVPFVL